MTGSRCATHVALARNMARELEGKIGRELAMCCGVLDVVWRVAAHLSMSTRERRLRSTAASRCHLPRVCGVLN